LDDPALDDLDAGRSLELELLEPLQEQLGEEAFERLWSAGRTGGGSPAGGLARPTSLLSGAETT
jgi:hypothetical protein